MATQKEFNKLLSELDNIVDDSNDLSQGAIELALAASEGPSSIPAPCEEVVA